MKKLTLTVCAFLFASLMSFNAQDDKNKNVNKNDKRVLEEHKNGGKKDEAGNAPRKSENNKDRKAEVKPQQQPIKKDDAKHDEAPN
jgi:hypothetical protein